MERSLADKGSTLVRTGAVLDVPEEVVGLAVVLLTILTRELSRQDYANRTGTSERRCLSVALPAWPPLGKPIYNQIVLIKRVPKENHQRQLYTISLT